ncbi:MAG: MBL fold metallo-hydrolase [Lachnospiraceae bacterium]|jgi:competence protein ComEC|nr:MBL fold metallo-hydrolase [Lachnospiraceae bacterium]
MKRQSLFWKTAAVFLALVLLLGGCGEKPPAETQDPLKITFFDVGKGDAILIETEKACMLIDTGYDDTAQVILDYLRQQGRERLDYLVLTHFDKDHVGGADQILGAVETERILQPDYASDSQQYLEYESTLKETDRQPELVTKPLKFSLEEAECLIYPPEQQEYEEEDNDFSLVISMTYKERRFLFAGDSERERLEELLNQTEFDLRHDLLKVPHHGRKEKNSEEFLKAVSPEIAVITCSSERPADDKVLNILKSLDTNTYLTSEGTITCLSDGKELKIWQE